LIGSIATFAWISTDLGLKRGKSVNPAFLSLIELFPYAQFAAGNINVGFTPFLAARSPAT
jgi:hypothetical protein